MRTFLTGLMCRLGFHNETPIVWENVTTPGGLAKVYVSQCRNCGTKHFF